MAPNTVTKTIAIVRILMPAATALLVLALVLPATPAHADDEPSFVDRVKTFEASIKGHRRARSTTALEQDSKDGVLLYEAAKDEEQVDKLRSRIAKSVGGLTKVKDEKVQLAALDALGEMGDAAGARYVRSHLKVLKSGRGAVVVMKAIEVAGEIGDDSFVPLLLKIVDKARYYQQAASAMRTLGTFRHCRRHRTKIVAELGTTLRKDLPGGPKRGQDSKVADTYIPGKSGNGGTARWQALSPVLPEALNALTGQKLATASDWMDTVQESKRSLGALFHDDDDA